MWTTKLFGPVVRIAPAGHGRKRAVVGEQSSPKECSERFCTRSGYLSFLWGGGSHSGFLRVPERPEFGRKPAGQGQPVSLAVLEQ